MHEKLKKTKVPSRKDWAWQHREYELEERDHWQPHWVAKWRIKDGVGNCWSPGSSTDAES